MSAKVIIKIKKHLVSDQTRSKTWKEQCPRRWLPAREGWLFFQVMRQLSVLGQIPNVSGLAIPSALGRDLLLSHCFSKSSVSLNCRMLSKLKATHIWGLEIWTQPDLPCCLWKITDIREKVILWRKKWQTNSQELSK